jgi:hypothetical protein
VRLRVPQLNVRVPSLKVSAMLVLLMLGFGVLIGEAARTSVKDTLLASARPRLELVVPPHHAGSSSVEAAGGEASGAEASEAPASETTATPAPSPHSSARRPAASAPSPQGSGGAAPTQPRKRTPDTKLPAIRHVFVIMLSDEPYAAVFGPESEAPYLTGKLEPRGALLPRYDAVAHEGLADEIALLSGQGPTAETAANCTSYTQIVPSGIGGDEQVLGSGCVYPASTQTLPGQLEAKHLSWRAYIGGIDEGGSSSGTCAHPVIGSADPGSAAASGAGPYATSINPIAYFASLTGASSCQKDDVGLSALKSDLASTARTPSFSYIAPSRCEDGAPTPCAPGMPAGLAPANVFLERVVPEILASKAYKQNGLLVITVDEAPASGEFADSSSCCGQPAYPNLPAALSETPSGRPRGGGAVGALLLSPFIKGPETSQEPYDHFSLLASIEEIFALKRLGYAALPAAKPLEASLFSELSG